MAFFSRKKVAGFVIAAGFFSGANVTTKAAAVATTPDTGVAISSASASSAVYTLRMHELHTGENIDIVYRVGDRYLPGAVAKLNYFLRDHRTNQVSHYDVRELSLIHI